MQMFAALCDNSDFFKGKINIALMLAPVARIDHLISSTCQSALTNKTLYEFLKKYPEHGGSASTQGMISAGFVKMTGVHNVAMACLCDTDTSLLSQSGVDTWLGHFPGGTSFKSLDHFHQIYNKKSFTKYDYGAEANLKKYGQEVAPDYDLSKCLGVPIALFCGLKD